MTHNPDKYLYFYENINITKFGGIDQLKGILNNFTKNQGNPFNFNLNTFINNQQINFNFNQSGSSKYIKINDYYFSYYDTDPLKINHYLECLFKGTSITIHVFLFLATLTSLIMILSDDEEDYKDNHYDDEDDGFLDDGYSYFLFMLMEYSFLYIFSFLIGLCICKCINDSKKCLRIDIKYSFNFEKIFIGSLININNKYTSYTLVSEFFVNEIDRFILQKNQINEIGFHLFALLKGNVSREVCYLKGQQSDLEGLLYILNDKKVQMPNYNLNKVEIQTLGECPPPTAY